MNAAVDDADQLDDDDDEAEQVKLDFFTENVTDWHVKFSELQGFDEEWKPT